MFKSFYEYLFSFLLSKCLEMKLPLPPLGAVYFYEELLTQEAALVLLTFPQRLCALPAPSLS